MSAAASPCSVRAPAGSGGGRDWLRGGRAFTRPAPAELRSASAAAPGSQRRRLHCLCTERRIRGGSSMSNSNLGTMQRLVEQLKLEAGVERIKVSQAAAELQQYCMQNACKDALLVGMPAGSNPFREPRSCALL